MTQLKLVNYKANMKEKLARNKSCHTKINAVLSNCHLETAAKVNKEECFYF